MIDEAKRVRVSVSIAGGVNLSSITAVKESGVTVGVAGVAKELKELLLA
ncbi:hypothetical protein D9V96_020625 [Zobellia laminariae]